MSKIFTAGNDLLELMNLILKSKFMFIAKTTESSFSLINTLDNGLDLQFSEGKSMDINESYCQQIFFGKQEPLIINDTTNHPFTCLLPLTKDLNIHAYIGVPIFYQNGEMYGTLCALDNKVRNFNQKDINELEKFANLYSYVLELERKVKMDSLTELYSRSYLFDCFEDIDEEGTLVLLDLDGFKKVNDKYGHQVGDNLLKEVALKIKRNLETDDVAFRLGGDEFVLIYPHLTNNKKIEGKVTDLLKSLANWDNFNNEVSISASIGVTNYSYSQSDLSSLLREADIAMYQAKKLGKNRFCFTSIED
ncbi:diguanylate cyclase domain-containing protein [Salipaludibacillus sp. HK11]|uniref:sensor domain-containing diguanylate cyclase n=1 Tax=Salipaludibacillus sp. HK11 TaxID=3394320 RepID=UPI0039FCB086